MVYCYFPGNIPAFDVFLVRKSLVKITHRIHSESRLPNDKKDMLITCSEVLLASYRGSEMLLCASFSYVGDAKIWACIVCNCTYMDCTKYLQEKIP